MLSCCTHFQRQAQRKCATHQSATMAGTRRAAKTRTMMSRSRSDKTKTTTLPATMLSRATLCAGGKRRPPQAAIPRQGPAPTRQEHFHQQVRWKGREWHCGRLHVQATQGFHAADRRRRRARLDVGPRVAAAPPVATPRHPAAAAMPLARLRLHRQAAWQEVRPLTQISYVDVFLSNCGWLVGTVHKCVQCQRERAALARSLLMGNLEAAIAQHTGSEWTFTVVP